MPPYKSLQDYTGQAGGSAKKKVIVAMSGGIDSSVAAALLKRASFDVIGIFMKFWSEPSKDGLQGAWNRCCSPEAERRARKVAKILKIPFYIFNFEKEFKKRIVDYFLKEHKAGLTPNPCIVCNKEIKFGLLLEKALALDADFVATGHYALIKKRKDGIHLLRGKDKNKDQSYFLWQLNQKQLKQILFPIGEYTKDEVRKLAKNFKLPLSNIPESMEICFIRTTVNDFLKTHLKGRPGPIAEPRTEASFIRGRQVHYGVKKIVGQHQGLWFYTIGQRKGIELPCGPYYVLDKNLKKNLLIVTKNQKDLYKKKLLAKDVNWISGKEPKLPLKIRAKIRYRHQPASAIITKNLEPKTYTLKFNKSQRAITPGQSVVFLKGQEVLGGGIII
ncbi:tRNA 2-thiouridine(34) synthase MnmA [Patescibacteria group bacterium]|nr:tRNA 2-thiouridine(34) synthase MnmA [Patescibacteria group bacterium]